MVQGFLIVLSALTSISFADKLQPGHLDFQQLAERLGIPTNEQGKCRRSQKAIAGSEADRMDAMERDFRKNDTNADDWSCVMLKRHLGRDTFKNCTPTPEDVAAFVPNSPLTVNGKVKYLGFIRQGYSYDVDTGDRGGARVTVRIRFTEEASTDPAAMADIREKLAYASRLWSEKSPNQSIEFRFQVAEAGETPHYTVKLDRKDKPTKYNSRWSTQDSKTIIAHEVGHMVGLDDEYALLRSLFWQVRNNVDTRRCNVRGLMCDYYDVDQKLYPYYFYVIMRRAVCAQAQLAE